MTKLTEKIQISEIVPRFLREAGNVQVICVAKRWNKPEKYYYKIDRTTYSEDEIKQQIEKLKSKNNISMWSLIELDEEQHKIFCKPHINYDNGKRFFNSDENMEFFLKYNSDMIEFV